MVRLPFLSAGSTETITRGRAPGLFTFSLNESPLLGSMFWGTATFGVPGEISLHSYLWRSSTPRQSEPVETKKDE